MKVAEETSDLSTIEENDKQSRKLTEKSFSRSPKIEKPPVYNHSDYRNGTLFSIL